MGEVKVIREEHKQLRILMAVGIILVVAGHLDFQVFDVGGLFPYYSFHVFIFLFVAGYFYRSEEKEHIFRYLGRKCKTLLLPYFVWNAVYGILAAVLHHFGFGIGGGLTLRNLFVEPFLGGHQFMYQFPAWFVPALFLIEAGNVIERRILSWLHLEKEWLIFIACLLVGIATVALAKGGHVWGNYKLPGRLLFMMPGFQLGRIYKEWLEEWLRKVPDLWYLAAVMGIQLVVCICCNGLAFSAVWVSSFANAAFIPYVTVITGIAFWLRISDWLCRIPCVSSMLTTVGHHTYSVMMHHVFWFMVIKAVCCAVFSVTGICADFDMTMFLNDVGYVYLIGGTEAAKWLYLVAGVALPVCGNRAMHAIMMKCPKLRGME